MKRKKLQCSVPTLMLAGVLCLTLAACGAKQSSDMLASDTDSAASAALPVKAMNAKRVDENPYMAKSDANIHHDGYNTDSTDEVLPLGIYPEINVSYEKNSVNGEFVVQCITPQDVEQYQEFAYDDLDTEALTAQAKEALERVCDRARATEAPEKGNYKLLLSEKNVRTLIDFYMDRSSSGMVYPGYSNYQAGMDVQGEKVQGEKLNITLHASNPYSSEGIPMKDLTLLKEGELKAIHGNARFAYYLGVEPTGIYSAVKLDNGTKAFEEMKKEPYLYVVSFSDFSMDSLSGYFGGEIRLAYLSDGEKVTPVTGGSVSGNLLELQKDMAFSTERYKDKDYDGPFAVEFHGVAVAGK